MLRIVGSATRVCDGYSRRDLLRLGGLSALGVCGAAGLPLPGYAEPRLDGFGRAKAVIFISLFGGPSHQDMWDLKPNAPAEVRGEFHPIRTNVPGIQITEHLPKLAQMADRYAIVRSVTHEDNGHGSAMYAAFSGWPHRLPNTNPVPDPTDYPAYGAVVSAVRRHGGPMPPFVALGGAQIVCGNQIPGQRAGFLGQIHEPFVVQDDPNRPDFSVTELAMPVASRSRMERRRSLLQHVDDAARLQERAIVARGLGDLQGRAFEMISSNRVRAAFALEQEEAKLRDRYGRTTFGQSCLLARRLVEAGVPCVNVNWSRGGPWDTHGDNFKGLKNSLLPPFDQSFSALLEDLTQRGLLESTLVVATGEFGRTPKVNPGAGRDHWAGVYSVVLAGGGVKGGQVYGASDEHAAFPAEHAVGPWDIGATLFHCLGVPLDTMVTDLQARPMPITRGEPIRALL